MKIKTQGKEVYMPSTVPTVRFDAGVLCTTARTWRASGTITDAEVNLAQAMVLLHGLANELGTTRRHARNADLQALQYELNMSMTSFLAKDFAEAKRHRHEAEKWRDSVIEK